MSFSWISVSCYILLRVNKYILASKKHILSYCCVYFMISLSFPSVYLCLYLQYPVNLILSVSFLCVIVLCCFLDLVGLHPSLLKRISLSLLYTRLSLPPSPVTDLPLPLCDTLHLLTFQLSCLPSLSVSLILFPRHSLRKGIWHRVEQLSEKNTSRLKQDRSSQEKQNEQWTQC